MGILEVISLPSSEIPVRQKAVHFLRCVTHLRNHNLSVDVQKKIYDDFASGIEFEGKGAIFFFSNVHSLALLLFKRKSDGLKFSTRHYLISVHYLK